MNPDLSWILTNTNTYCFYSPGKHFVRSRTVASIPLHQYLTPEAVQDAYKTNQQPVSPVIRTTMAEENDDISGPDNLRSKW